MEQRRRSQIKAGMDLDVDGDAAGDADHQRLGPGHVMAGLGPRRRQHRHRHQGGQQGIGPDGDRKAQMKEDEAGGHRHRQGLAPPSMASPDHPGPGHHQDGGQNAGDLAGRQRSAEQGQRPGVPQIGPGAVDVGDPLGRVKGVIGGTTVKKAVGGGRNGGLAMFQIAGIQGVGDKDRRQIDGGEQREDKDDA